MLEINLKEDILIPFNHIGDVGWEIKTRTIIESLADNFNHEISIPISDEQIILLEQRLKTSLPKSLKIFYKTFGLADIGEQLQAFDEIDWIKNIWKENPELGPNFTKEDIVVLPYLISFSDYLGNGNMFCFHSETKEIYYYDHDAQPYLTHFFQDFSDYLKGCLVFAQIELFGEVDQEDVGIWTEERVSSLFGHEVVRKWRY